MSLDLYAGQFQSSVRVRPHPPVDGSERPRPGSGPTWTGSPAVSPSWTNLVKLGPTLTNLVKLGQTWSNLDQLYAAQKSATSLVDWTGTLTLGTPFLRSLRQQVSPSIQQPFAQCNLSTCDRTQEMVWKRRDGVVVSSTLKQKGPWVFRLSRDEPLFSTLTDGTNPYSCLSAATRVNKLKELAAKHPNPQIKEAALKEFKLENSRDCIWHKSTHTWSEKPTKENNFLDMFVLPRSEQRFGCPKVRSGSAQVHQGFTLFACAGRISRHFRM